MLQRLQLLRLVHVRHLQPVAPGVEVLLDHVQGVLQNCTLLWSQALQSVVLRYVLHGIVLPLRTAAFSLTDTAFMTFLASLTLTLRPFFMKPPMRASTFLEASKTFFPAASRFLRPFCGRERSCQAPIFRELPPFH